jgi:hypothetical protein
MNRRRMLLACAVLLTAKSTSAHHGWSAFDQDKPIYLAGRIKAVRWQNPHAEVVIEVAAGLGLPADLASRGVPAQQQGIDGASVIRKVQVPERAAGEWTLEFAPLFRMQAWGLAEPLKAGEAIEVVGYIAPRLAKGRLVRVEYLFARGSGYGLRSMPVS